MFLASNICEVSSGTVTALYCWEPREVSGAKPGMKKWRRGNGTLSKLSYCNSKFVTYHVDTQFTEISIKLTRESEASGNTGHGNGDKMVKIAIGWGGQFEGSNDTLVNGYFKWFHTWSRYHRGLRYQCSMSDQCSQPIDGLIEWHCRAQQRYQRPLVMGQRRMCSWHGLGTPRGSLRSRVFPYRNRYHHRGSG